MVSTKTWRMRAKSERVRCQKSEREPTDMFVVSSTVMVFYCIAVASLCSHYHQGHVQCYYRHHSGVRVQS